MDGRGEEAAFPHVVQCFAGGLAEALIDPHVRNPDRLQEDLDEARRFAAAAVCGVSRKRSGRKEVTARAQLEKQDELNALGDAALAAAQSLVRRHRLAIMKVAKLLRERTQLSAAEVTAIVRECPLDADSR